MNEEMKCNQEFHPEMFTTQQSTSIGNRPSGCEDDHDCHQWKECQSTFF